MSIITDERVAFFVSQQLGVAFCPPLTCLGTERNGKVINGIIFNQFEGPNVHMSAAGKCWSLGFVRAVGEYVYTQLSCIRMTVTTESPDVVDYALRLGGALEGVMRDYYGEGRDAYLVGVLRDEWRFARKTASARLNFLHALLYKGRVKTMKSSTRSRSGSNCASAGGRKSVHSGYAAKSQHGRSKQPVGFGRL